MSDSGAVSSAHTRTPVADEDVATIIDRIDPTALDALLVQLLAVFVGYYITLIILVKAGVLAVTHG